MSVQRRVNWISQQRVDVPDMRSVESAVSNDFDQLVQAFVTGTNQGYILRGFEIAMAGAIGGAASGLQLLVDPGAVMHIASSVSGTILMVPTGTQPQQLNSATNTIVDGAFAPSAINYVGLEYERYIDDTTSSQVYIWDPTSNTETTKNAPRAQILRYRIKISTSTFAANVLPIATVTTDSGNNVLSVTDARWLLFRLGQGGANPNPFYTYNWPEGRTENASSSSSNAVNPFEGGDKAIGDLKTWMNAVMSAFIEIKGTTYWYSTGSSGSLESLRQDLGNTVITGSGAIAHGEMPTSPYTPTTPGQINWDQDIYITVVGTRLSYKLTANPSSTNISLAEGDAAYITLVRGVEVSPNLIFGGAFPTIVTSVGGIAWTSSLQAGDFVKVGADTDAGYYQIQSVDSLTQVTLTEAYTGTPTGPAGAKAKYSFGTYQSSPAPSTARDIYIAPREDVPVGQDVFWLFLRQDHGGAIARVYVRFLGAELEDQESEDISSNQSKDTLVYIGAPLASSQSPNYTSALNPGSLPEITDLQVGAASTITSNQYFFINSSGDGRKYYVWFNKDGTGVDPNPAYTDSGIEVVITTGQTAAQVAVALASALSGTFYDDFSAVQRPIPNTDTVRVTNASAGVTANAVNFNVGSLVVTIIQNGTGSGNFIIQDGDNLTLAIKKLDAAIAAIVQGLALPTYDEVVTIVASGATPPTSLNGPVISGTSITIPNNTRLGNIPQTYVVGNANLEVYLNGQFLLVGLDYSENGVAGTDSSSITTLQQLEVGDDLTFRLGSGGGGGGGGGIGPQGPPGPSGPPGADALGGPVAISTKTGAYTVLLTDCFLRANAASGTVPFTLPPAATATGKAFYFKKIDATANAMSITANGAEVIDGNNSVNTTVQYETFSIISNGISWDIF